MKKIPIRWTYCFAGVRPKYRFLVREKATKNDYQKKSAEHLGKWSNLTHTWIFEKCEMCAWIHSKKADTHTNYIFGRSSGIYDVYRIPVNSKHYFFKWMCGDFPPISDKRTGSESPNLRRQFYQAVEPGKAQLLRSGTSIQEWYNFLPSFQRVRSMVLP